MRLELKRIKLMSVQNGICTSEVFQIEVSDGAVHQPGSCQNINLYPARVFTVTRVFRSLYVFTNPNDHSNKNTQQHFHW